MVNLIAILLGLALPVVLTALDIPHALTGAVVTASTLVWPGYVVTFLLWPLSGQLSLTQRWSLTPLFSLLILVGMSMFAWLVLQNATPIIVYALTTGAMLVVMVFAHKAVRQLKWREVGVTWGICASFAVLVASAAAIPPQGLSEFLFPQPGRSPGAFTDFYVVTRNLPRQAVVGQAVTATIGIVNHEGVSTRYTVIVKLGDETIGAGPILSLEDRERREQSVGFTFSEPGNGQAVDFILERNGVAAPYRQLQLKLDVQPGNGP